MSRPLRIEYPGAMYHVMNRGNQRQDVFRKKIDCETFLERLGHFVELFNVELYCYVLMNNHFHLLLRTREANLGRFMQSFLTSFTIILNKRNKKSGHIFQGRYKAHLVESEQYISTLSRYIHLNPTRIKKYKDISIDEKKNILTQYTWSSYLAHIGLKEPDKFIDTTPVLSNWGTNNIAKMKNYRKYVEEGLYKDVENPFDLALRQQIIGSETFAERITRTKIMNMKIRDRREEGKLHDFQSSLDPETIIEAVIDYFNISRKQLLQRRSPEKLPRQIAMYLCAKYCTSKVSLSDIGKLFSISISGIAIARDRMNKEMGKEEKQNIKKDVNIIIENLKLTV